MSWETVALGDVCRVIAGQSPKGKHYNKEGNGVAFYQGKKDFGAVYINPPTVWTTEVTKLASKGDILMSVRAPVGPVNFSNDEVCIGRGLAAIQHNSKINRFYLFYYFLKIQNELVGSSGAVFNSINKSQIESLRIPLPPLLIQEKIVAKLDAIFAEIDKAIVAAEANVKNAEALFQSYLTEIFECTDEEWELKTLSDISSYMGRGKSKHRPRNDEKLFGGKYPFIQTGDVRNSNMYVTSYTQTYNELGLRQSKLWPANTVCITIAANIAEVAILGFDACFPDSVIGVIPDQKQTNSEFLFFMLLYAQKKIKSFSKGSAQENINLATFENMHFKIPSIDNQIQIVEQLNHLKLLASNVINAKLNKIISLTALKQSILQQAFNGELVKE